MKKINNLLSLQPYRSVVIAPFAPTLKGHASRPSPYNPDYRHGVKVAELIAMLEKDGWTQVRMKGSHRQFRHPTKRGTVTVAGKPSIDVPPGTLNGALKQAGLKK